jgi:precorrin-6Y C5,15-methyltransferase (decarboxylating)
MSDEKGGERRVETWLAVVGIGEDGIDGLSPAARALVAQAEFVVGGRRHLALAGDLAAETFAWPSPIEGALDVIEARRGRPVCVLASGDPFFFGVGAMLMRRFSPGETLCVPAPSAFALAAARLGWSQQDCAMLSLHGRPLEAILPHLQPGARVLALSWDEATPAKLVALLAARGLGRSRLTVCEAMGGPRERIRASEAESFALDNIVALNTIALDVIADRDAKILPRAPGLPDDWFEHDGQITKRDIRAVTLSALAPRRGEVLWDVGAGSGSIGIEWMLADPANRAIAIEANAERAARAARNALNLGVPALEVVVGRAPEAFRDLGTPGAVFIGGGAAGAIEAAAAALRPGGRLVVNAVTLETQALLVEERAKRGGDLVQIAVAHAEPVGRFTGWRTAMPIVQWRWTRP